MKWMLNNGEKHRWRYYEKKWMLKTFMRTYYLIENE